MCLNSEQLEKMPLTMCFLPHILYKPGQKKHPFCRQSKHKCEV